MRFAPLILTLIGAVCAAQQPVPARGIAADPWFGTFSIIALDPATSELGVGVQARAFGAGAAVPYAKPGVGAVATQASANRQYGPKAIALLEQGLPVEDVVKRITDEDAGRATRQVAVIDAKGRSAVYTGRRVIERNSDRNDPVHYGGYAGHVSGPNYSVQGNTLASVEVVKAMAAAFEQSQGRLAERLMNALDAGQAKGGDTRGMQSAGILVVRPLDPKSPNTVERIVDIRVDDHENPFKELRRLLNMTLGVQRTLTDNAAKLAEQGKLTEAIADLHKALEINPRSEEIQYALAQRYAQSGDTKNAIKWLTTAINRQPHIWKSRAAEDPLFAKLRTTADFKKLLSN